MSFELEVIGDLDEDILTRRLTLAISNKGRETPRGQWFEWKTDVRETINQLFKHTVGKKDGKSFVAGSCLGGERKITSIGELSLLCLDLDTGDNLDDLLSKIQKLGLFAIIHTTHSHMKDVTELSQDGVIKWINKGSNYEPTVEDYTSYLIEVKRYRPYILDSAKLLKVQHTSNGVMAFIQHAPIPKFRIILPLDRPFVFSERPGMHRDAVQEWKELYAGASKLLGCYFDRACVDPSRLYHTARHPSGSQDVHTIVVGGRCLRIIEGVDGQPADVHRVTAEELKRGQLDAYEAAAAALGGTNQGGNGIPIKTPGLVKFYKENSTNFDVESWLYDIDQDNDRGSRSGGAGRIHRCPNDDAHSNPGDENDKGFFVINGPESEVEKCVAHCSHDGCATLTTLNFIDLFCQEHNQTVDDLKPYVAMVVEEQSNGRYTDTDSVDDDNGYDNNSSAVDRTEDSDSATKTDEEESIKPFRNLAAAQTALSALQDGDISAFGKFARQVGASKLSITDVAVLKNEVIKRKTIEIRHWNDEIKAGKKEAKGDNAEGVDKDGIKELKEYNKLYAKVLHGGVCKIMKKPENIGDPCSFLSVEAFKTFKAHDQIEVDSKLTSLPNYWITWPGVEVFDRVEFEPGKPKNSKTFNLWTGFKTVPKQGDWSLMHDHIKHCICGDNEEIYHWFMTWLADLFQNPGEKKGSSIVLTGKKGTGKSILFKTIKDMIGPHALTVASRSAFLGDFNSHQIALILMVCEEAHWAGDASLGGKLKDLITNDKMMLTPKGVDSFEVSNHMRFIFISNEGYVVPATLEDERRYLALEISDEHMGDMAYFQRIQHQMYKKGGMEAMLYDLLKWIPEDNDWEILRLPPKTDALTDQGKANLHPWERFFMSMVRNGFLSYVPPVEGLPIVELSYDAENFVNKAIIREYYNRHVSKSSVYKVGDDDVFEKGMKDWLYWDGDEYEMTYGIETDMDSPFARSTGIKFPSLNEIRRRLTEDKNLKFKTVKKKGE